MFLFLQSLPVSTSPSSKTFANWVNVPLPIYNYFYLFNITNVEELLRSSVTPDVQEIGEGNCIMQQVSESDSHSVSTGPFVFREHRQKIAYTFENDDNTVRYNQTRTFEFVEEMSLSLDTEIYHLNVPLIVSCC